MPGLRISGKDSEVKTTRQFLTGTILKKIKKEELTTLRNPRESFQPGCWKVDVALFLQMFGKYFTNSAFGEGF